MKLEPTGVVAELAARLASSSGELYSIIGATGAGRTTMLTCISGLSKSEDGEVTRGDIL